MTTATSPGPSNVLYVDQVYGLLFAAGVRGNQNIPFRTIQLALNAALTDDVVQLAPQSFAIAASLTVPVAVSRLTVQGWGQGGAISAAPPIGITSLVGAAGINVFDLGANLGLTFCRIRNMSISFNGGDAIRADGSLYAVNTYLGGSLYVDSVTFIQQAVAGFALNLKYVRSARITNCNGTSTTGGAISIVSCGVVEFDHSIFPSSATLLSYDGTDPLRTATQLLVRLRATVLGGVGANRGVTLTGQPKLEGDAASRVGFLFGAALSVAAGLVPSVAFYGQVGTSGTGTAFDFQTAGTELPDTATALTWDFRGCQFFGAAKFKVAGAASPQSVRMEGAQALNTSTPFVVGAGINLRLDGAIAPSAAITTPDPTGSVLPPSPWKLAPVAAATPSTAFVFGFRTAVATYQVTAQSDTILNQVVGVATGLTTLGFNVALPVLGGAGLITAVATF